MPVISNPLIEMEDKIGKCRIRDTTNHLNTKAIQFSVLRFRKYMDYLATLLVSFPEVFHRLLKA